jgi:hypothetical protein
MLRHTATFGATGDDGGKYTVHVFTDFIPAPTPQNPSAEWEWQGPKRLRTSAGRAVTRRARGEYQIVRTGVILRTGDPAAP